VFRNRNGDVEQKPRDDSGLELGQVERTDRNRSRDDLTHPRNKPRHCRRSPLLMETTAFGNRGGWTNLHLDCTRTAKLNTLAPGIDQFNPDS
jgi:hypothetical protein